MKTTITLLLAAASMTLAAQNNNGSNEVATSKNGESTFVLSQKEVAGLNNEFFLQRFSSLGESAWSLDYGGKGYDQPVDVLALPDGGCIMAGHTSSKGKGNFDVAAVRVDQDGKIVWEQLFGGFFNEKATQIRSYENGTYYIYGTRQTCETEDVLGNCETKPFGMSIDGEGNQLGGIWTEVDGVWMELSSFEQGVFTAQNAPEEEGEPEEEELIEDSASNEAASRSTSLGNAQLLLYPNPTQTKAFVDGLNTGSTLLIYDLDGREMLQELVQDARTIVDVSAWPKGMYIVVAELENGETTQLRMVKD